MSDSPKPISREWRVVDEAGEPYDFGEWYWPVFETETDALAALDDAQYNDHVPAGTYRLEVREVQPWKALS